MTLEELKQHEFCTREEISEILRVSTRTVNRMMAEGQIKFIKFGDNEKAKVRIPASEIERLLSEASERQAEKARENAGKKKRKVKTPIQTEQSSTGEKENAD